jgi:hypothetical protein
MTILHVGMPKTGSTSLQKALAEKQLLTNCNETQDGKDQTWALRAIGIEMDLQNHQEIEPLTAEKIDRGFVSDEDFCLASPELASQFRNALQPKTTVLITRGFADLCESSWREMVKHGETRTFLEWMHEVAFADPSTSVYSRRVRSDFCAFAWKANLVKVYDKNILSWFNEIFFSNVTLTVDTHVNNSLSPEATETLRRLNNLLGFSHSELEECVDLLLDVDRSADRLFTSNSCVELSAIDAEINSAITLSEVVNIKSAEIEVRDFDENLCDYYMSVVLRKP